MARSQPRSRFVSSDELWERFQGCLAPRPPRDPARGGRPRADDRACLDGILFVLNTGCQWNALTATGLCPSSTANDRFREWCKDGTFERFFHRGVAEYDQTAGIDWSFLSMDGALTKAPLGGEDTGPNPTDRGKKGRNAAS